MGISFLNKGATGATGATGWEQLEKYNGRGVSVCGFKKGGIEISGGCDGVFEYKGEYVEWYGGSANNWVSRDDVSDITFDDEYIYFEVTGGGQVYIIID